MSGPLGAFRLNFANLYANAALDYFDTHCDRFAASIVSDKAEAASARDKWQSDLGTLSEWRPIATLEEEGHEEQSAY